MSASPMGANDCDSRQQDVDTAGRSALVSYGAAAALGAASMILFLTAPQGPAPTVTAWACAPMTSAWGLGCARTF